MDFLIILLLGLVGMWLLVVLPQRRQQLRTRPPGPAQIRQLDTPA